MKLTFQLVALLVLLFAGSALAQVPQLLNYQGRVAVGTTNFTGTGQFKFALVNGNGSTTYWSNNGSSTAGSQPTSAVSLPVSNGLYSVLLGDTSLANMTAVPVTVFDNADVRLRVWFNDGVNGSQLLTPDQRIAANGYLPDAAVTAAKIADGTITQAKLAFAIGGGGIPNGIQTFTTVGNQTFTVPAGVTRIQAEAWGGGGGAAGNSDVGASGGGGGYSRTFLTVSPGQVLTVVIGAGGTGAFAPNTSTSAQATGGAASSVKHANGDALITAGGGGGGAFTGVFVNGTTTSSGGSSGIADVTALIGRDGYGGGAGVTGGNTIPGGDAAAGTVASPLGANVFAGPGYNNSLLDRRRSRGTGGLYAGSFSGAGVAQNGFPGFVVISW